MRTIKSIVALLDSDNQRKIKTALTISAIAKVMARNQSHNIGSHVLSRLVSPNDVSIDSIMTSSAPKYTCLFDKETLNNSVEKRKKEILKDNVGITDKEAKRIADKEYYYKLLS